MCPHTLTDMYIVYDLEKGCLVGLPVKSLEKARERARACRDAGREVILRAIPQDPLPYTPDSPSGLENMINSQMDRINQEYTQIKKL